MKITKEQLEQAIFQELLTYAQIAQKYNMGHSTVQWYIKKYEIVTPQKMKVKPTKEELYDLYFEKKLSTQEIITLYRIGQTTLAKLFKEYGFDFRPIGTNQNHHWTYDEVKEHFKNNGCELLATEYKNNTTLMKYRCSCGNEAEIRFGAFMSGQRCKKCGTQKMATGRRFTFEQVQKVFAERGAVLLATEYKNAITPLEYICHKCGAKAYMSLNNFQKGYGCSNCKRLRFLGENNPHYNPNLTDDDRLEVGRYEERYGEFRRKVFARDRACVICGSKTNKVVHHLDGYSDNPEKRTDIDNAVTLCEVCHKKFHSIYGYGKNTKAQFKEFEKACK